MIVFTRFPLEHLLKLSPEYLYLDIPREFPAYSFSRRPPWALKRSRNPLKLAKRLAELMEEELLISSRELSSGVLYAEGLKVSYVYDHGILRKENVSYAEEFDEPYAIERGRKISRPLSMLLLDYDAIIVEFAKDDGFSNKRQLGYPMPGVHYRKGDPLGVRKFRNG